MEAMLFLVFPSQSIHRQTSDCQRGGSLAQVFLVLAALISVPIMLLPKPLVLQKRHKARAAQLEQYGRVSPTEDDEEAGQGTLRMAAPAGVHHEEEFDFSEIMVHQVSQGVASIFPSINFVGHFKGSGFLGLSAWCSGCLCRAAATGCPVFFWQRFWLRRTGEETQGA